MDRIYCSRCVPGYVCIVGCTPYSLTRHTPAELQDQRVQMHPGQQAPPGKVPTGFIWEEVTGGQGEVDSGRQGTSACKRNKSCRRVAEERAGSHCKPASISWKLPAEGATGFFLCIYLPLRRRCATASTTGSEKGDQAVPLARKPPLSPLFP